MIKVWLDTRSPLQALRSLIAGGCGKVAVTYHNARAAKSWLTLNHVLIIQL